MGFCNPSTCSKTGPRRLVHRSTPEVPKTTKWEGHYLVTQHPTSALRKRQRIERCGRRARRRLDSTLCAAFSPGLDDGHTRTMNSWHAVVDANPTTVRLTRRNPRRIALDRQGIKTNCPDCFFGRLGPKHKSLRPSFCSAARPKSTHDHSLCHDNSRRLS